MNLHEFQSKALFSEYGIPVPEGYPAATVDDAVAAARALGGERWVVKAQVHAGGRGKAGGVKLVDSEDALKEAASSLLGSRLVTHQSGADGQPVNQVLVEATSDIDHEYYLACLVDRSLERVVVIASSEGGMDIESVAARNPEKILKAVVDPIAGLQPYQCRELAFALGLGGPAVAQFTRIVLAVYRLFTQRDLSLVEINPLITTKQGNVMALDAKINLDDSASFRQPDLMSLRDPSQEEEKEYRAQQFGLSYVALDGEIGCMVNGAGLAMATMDLIKLHGGSPANFLDVGGGTTAEKVAEAFKIILADEKVKAVLVNIFGGIVRCDLIAEGIITAIREVGIKVPVVVRLEGTNVEKGKELLEHSGLDVITASGLTHAAQRVVGAAKGVV